MQPDVAQINLPTGYGRPHRTLDWSHVRTLLAESDAYWIATSRRDGRPHVVPVDGIWLDDALYFGGHPDTVHQRTLRRNPEIAVHLADPHEVVIAEGRAEWVTAGPALARRLAAASKEKYGYGQPASAYRNGTWCLRPARVLAWTSVATDPTRFTFPV
jgi:nitroimidazol reductase NimA-like FMN-containing flavoprotein (pyridoxamine 5'-phosphate oxidase superfamily)